LRRKTALSEYQDKPLVSEEAPEQVEPKPTLRKKFIEPEISQPVPVLEATSFFQAGDSGATN
jgi:hypothetical protein